MHGEYLTALRTPHS
jgi:hypothetical protein